MEPWMAATLILGAAALIGFAVVVGSYLRWVRGNQIRQVDEALRAHDEAVERRRAEGSAKSNAKVWTRRRKSDLGRDDDGGLVEAIILLDELMDDEDEVDVEIRRPELSETVRYEPSPSRIHRSDSSPSYSDGGSSSSGSDSDSSSESSGGGGDY